MGCVCDGITFCKDHKVWLYSDGRVKVSVGCSIAESARKVSDGLLDPSRKLLRIDDSGNVLISVQKNGSPFVLIDQNGNVDFLNNYSPDDQTVEMWRTVSEFVHKRRAFIAPLLIQAR